MPIGDEITIQDALDCLSRSATDTQAWGVVFRQFWPYVFGLCRSLFRDARPLSDGEDVAQEVFVAFSRSLHQGRLRLPLTEEDVRTLLLVMARNRVRDHIRREHRQRRDSRRQVPWPDEGQADVARPSVESQLEQDDALERLLAQLDPFDRRVAELLLDGWSPPEIARQLKTTAKTVRRHQNRLASLFREVYLPDTK